jgi:hypothetical protein
MTPRALNRLWAALLAATALTWALGEAGAAGGIAGGAAAAVWALSLAKGAGIALRFMELQHAPPLWRRFVLGWLVAVVGVLAALH